MEKMEKRIANGIAAAAILAAGIGSFSLGIFVLLAEISAQAKQMMILSLPVGPLSGKTTFTVVLWLASWAVLHLWWRNRDVRFNEIIVAALILIGFGFLGTFPPFFELFTVAH